MNRIASYVWPAVAGCMLTIIVSLVWQSRSSTSVDVARVEPPVLIPSTDSPNAMNKLQTLLATNQQRLDQLLADNRGLQNSVYDLTQRMDELEKSGNAKSPSDKNIDKEKTVSQSHKDEITEAQFGQWLEQSIDVNYIDAGATEWARSQAVEALNHAPGVTLDDMKCGDHVCMASFTRAGTNAAQVTELFGYPPFMGDGFTVDQPDGRVLVYFSEAGYSLNELRGQAKQQYQTN